MTVKPNYKTLQVYGLSGGSELAIVLLWILGRKLSNHFN